MAESEWEWQAAKRKMAAVVPTFEDRVSGPSPYFKLSDTECATLTRLASIPPATRSFAEVRTMLNLLRGADLLLQMDDDAACTVASSMRLKEFEKGDLIATEQNASDSFLLVVKGLCTVLIRDVTVARKRAPLYHVHPGESFAEASLVENSRKAPSLVAGDSGAVLLRVSRDDFHAALSSWQLELLERKVLALEAVPCLMGEDKRLLRPLAERMSQKKHHAAAVLVGQGEPATHLHVLGSGEARVLLRTEGGEVLQVGTLGPGDVFGELGVLLTGQHTASVVAAADVTLFSIAKADLQAVADPSLLAQLTTQASSYPSEHDHVEALHLGHHWQAYKKRMIFAGTPAP